MNIQQRTDMRINKLLLALLLIGGTVFAQEYPGEFTKLDGWSIEGEKQFYSRDNLYDYINGASDFYLGYDFQDLWVVDYKNEAGQMLTLELYRHGDKLKTFGIYSEERPQSAKLQEIGAQGFLESGAVFFLADNYYVKVYNSRPEVGEADFVAFAKAVAQSICSDCGMPHQFESFPENGRVALSERYMPENFMGISGFNGVCTVKYEHQGESFRLFVYEASDKNCRALMEKYFKRLKYKKKLKEKTYSFDDSYLGKVQIYYKEGRVAGMLDAKNPDSHQVLFEALIR
ncbi:DUF6599 family protein [Carboxylicivirga marina]|uniref:DUF6599 family protein n=1 Tax=Carboxylicivirga marina TaxID=2800988 RepID=UPI002594D1DE|nr:DUF6599 family protein [uncultured Carboxylicivirga sp.]